MNNKQAQGELQDKSASNPVSEHTSGDLNAVQGPSKKKDKKFQGIVIKGNAAYDRKTIKLKFSARETDAHIIQIVDVDFLNPETGDVIFSVNGIEPANALDLYAYVAEAIRDNRDFLFSNAQTCYRWTGNKFYECDLFEQWLYDLTHATGGRTAGTWRNPAHGSPYAVVMEAISSAPKHRRFIRVTSAGSCKGIPFADGQGVYDADTGEWYQIPHNPKHMNFWALNRRFDDMMELIAEFKGDLPYGYVIDEEKVETETINGEEFYTYRDEDLQYYVSGDSMENLKWANFLKKNPYLAKDSETLTKLGRFLSTSLLADQIEVMQQWMGYHLVKHMMDSNLEKFMIMRGGGGDGKSQILWLIDALVGGKGVGSEWISADNIDKRSTHLLEGVRAILSSETEKINLTFIKSLVSGEPILAEPKFKDPYSFVPDAIVTLAYNPLPNIGEKSEAIARRLIYLEMPGVDKEVKEEAGQGRKVDIAVKIIEEEMDLLIAFAMIGAARLLDKGDFVIPDSVTLKTRELAEEADPMNAFAKECLIFNPDACIAKKELYEAWGRWIDETGRKVSKDANMLDSLFRYAKLIKKPIEEQKKKANYPKSKWLRRGSTQETEFVFTAMPPRPDVIYGVMIGPDNPFGAVDGIGTMSLKKEGRGGARKRIDTSEIPFDVRQKHEQVFQKKLERIDAETEQVPFE